MRQLLFHLALVGGIIFAAAALDHPELVQGSLCFTFLSTYLAPVQTWAVNFDPVKSSSPAIDGDQTSTSLETRPTVNLLDSSSLELPTLPIDGEDAPTVDPSFSTKTTVSREASGTLTSNAASVTSGTAGVSGQGIILLVDESEETRKRQQRAIRGFVNNGNTAASESCSDAGFFSLSAGQLLDGGNPIFYAGEDFKQLAGQGAPPIDAITRTFVNSGGLLLFENPLLPNGQAGYCQDPETSEVLITFASAPLGCVPVSLTVYLVEQCQDGQIIDADTSSVTSTISIRSTINDEIASTSSTRLTEATMPLSPEELPTFANTEDSTSITVIDAESSTIPSDSSKTDVEPPGTLLTTSASTGDPSSSPSEPDTTVQTTSAEGSVPEPSSEATTGDLSPTPSDSVKPSPSSSIPQEESSSEGQPSLSTSPEVSSDDIAQSTTSSLNTDSVSTYEIASSISSPEDTSLPTPTSSKVTSSEETSEATSEPNSVDPTTSGNESSATYEVTSSEELSTSAVTTEPSAPGTCGGPLTTVALAQPTNIYEAGTFFDDEIRTVTLPFSIGLAPVRGSTVHVTPNGLMSLAVPRIPTNYNRDLPDEGLPLVSILPFWDDLYFLTTLGHGLFYEVYQSTLGGREVTFEWVGYSKVDDGPIHFSVTFYENFARRLNFKYYTTGDKGASATVGFQRNLVPGGYYKWSFNEPNAVPDGTILTLDSEVFFGFTQGTFDNTACGKPEQPPEEPTP